MKSIEDRAREYALRKTKDIEHPQFRAVVYDTLYKEYIDIATEIEDDCRADFISRIRNWLIGTNLDGLSTSESMTQSFTRRICKSIYEQ